MYSRTWAVGYLRMKVILWIKATVKENLQWFIRTKYPQNKGYLWTKAGVWFSLGKPLFVDLTLSTVLQTFFNLKVTHAETAVSTTTTTTSSITISMTTTKQKTTTSSLKITIEIKVTTTTIIKEK